MGRIAADSSVFHAIADPTRRAILDLLRDGEMTVTALMEGVAGEGAGVAGLRTKGRPARSGPRRRSGKLPALPNRRPASLSQSAFSQHLAVLRRAGLVASRKSGRARVYAVRPQPLREVVDWIAEYDKFWTEKLDNLGRYLDRTHGIGGDGAATESAR